MPLRIPFRSNFRRGFALIFVLTSIALLFTFLITAQGSVMAGRQHILRAGDRLTSVENANSVLDELTSLARSEVKSGLRKPGEDWSYGSGDSVVALTPRDPLYGKGSGIRHREGDLLLTIVPRPGGPEQEKRFLINVMGGRSGPISLN